MDINLIMPKLRQVELEILNVIDEFCTVNEIEYSLAYGTLLGAVRHKGFIPWDDDIDIFMAREEYDKFIALWNENPVENYTLVTPDTDKNYSQTFAKIRKNHTTFLEEKEKIRKDNQGIFVDIFPCDRVAEGKLGKKIQKIYALLMILYSRGYPPRQANTVLKTSCNILLKIIPRKHHGKIRKVLEKKFIAMSGKNTEYVSACTLESASIVFSKTMFDNITKLDFEDKKYSATAEWDSFLTRFYGDYMKLPPEEDRIWKHHPILIDFEHNYEELV